MINLFEVTETNKMIEQENLDVRTITIGISLLDCMDHDIDVLCQNIYKKITSVAKDLVKTGEEIEVSAVANASIKNEVGKWDVCLVGPQLVFAVDSIHQQLNIPVASIEPRAYAMADGAAAIEMAKKLLG